MDNPNVSALQAIFNIFRQKQVGELFPVALEKKVGILARVPLASGLLTGKFKKGAEFEKDDHRNYNQNGEAFNVGETFAGLSFGKGVQLSEQLRWIAENRGNMTRITISWNLEQLFLQ